MIRTQYQEDDGSNSSSTLEVGVFLLKEDKKLVAQEGAYFISVEKINALRTSHYSNDEYLYYLCDKYGIYVMGETNLESHALMNQGEKQANFKNLAMDRTVTTFNRPKNRTSIVMWSTGNENYYSSSASYANGMFYDLIWYFKNNDSTRPIHSESSDGNNGTDMRSNMYPSVDTLYSRAAAKNDAETAAKAAEEAKAAADVDKAAAEAAQAKAEVAQTAAETAEEEAKKAQTAAETAQTKAEAAQAAAKEAEDAAKNYANDAAAAKAAEEAQKKAEEILAKAQKEAEEKRAEAQKQLEAVQAMQKRLESQLAKTEFAAKKVKVKAVKGVKKSVKVNWKSVEGQK